LGSKLQPILASDFGSLGSFLLGIPALAVAVVLGLIGLILGFRALALWAGIVSLLTGGFFFFSAWSRLDAAVVCAGSFSVLVGVGFIYFAKRLRP
jgi:hypothetical protein